MNMQNSIRHRIMRFVLGGVDKDVWNWQPNYSFLRTPDRIHKIETDDHDCKLSPDDGCTHPSHPQYDGD